MGPAISFLSSPPTDACTHPQLSSIDLNDQVEGDDRAFEVWHEREDSVRKYLLQARTAVIKSSWVKEICGIQQRLALPVWSESPESGTGLGLIRWPGDFPRGWVNPGWGPLAVVYQEPERVFSWADSRDGE